MPTCQHVKMSTCQHVNMSTSYPLVFFSSCLLILLSSCLHVLMSSSWSGIDPDQHFCYNRHMAPSQTVVVSFCHPVIVGTWELRNRDPILDAHHVIMSSVSWVACKFVGLSICQFVNLLACELFSLSACELFSLRILELVYTFGTAAGAVQVKLPLESTSVDLNFEQEVNCFFVT